MPNPYHDAEGRFCSKGEMSAAIDTAQKNGDFGTYYALRRDYEAASATSETSSNIFAEPAPTTPYSPVNVNDQLTVLSDSAATNTELRKALQKLQRTSSMSRAETAWDKSGRMPWGTILHQWQPQDDLKEGTPTDEERSFVDQSWSKGQMGDYMYYRSVVDSYRGEYEDLEEELGDNPDSEETQERLQFADDFLRINAIIRTLD